MKAELQSLKGKYYGTIIKITHEDYTTEVTIWRNADFTPSNRYLESYGYTEQQWTDNALVDNGWGELVPIRELDLVCDSHFESKFSYELALKILEKLND